jgi:IS5 family transposase
MRFCGLSIADPLPDANTLWDFREALIAAGAFETLFERLDKAIKDAGYIPPRRSADRRCFPDGACALLRLGGQIVDASLVASPRQRNTDAEKEAIKSGKSASEIWPDKPAKAAQKDTDARWTVKSSKGKIKADGTVQSDLTIPEFGYKTHISIDVAHRFIRRQKVTDAAAHDGARLREGLVDPTNTASGVWADTAYRSAANEAFLADRGKVSRIHRRKPAGKPMPKRTAKANVKKSKIRARIEHVFAHHKERMRLFIRSVGLKRAEATIVMANIAYNLGRWRWWETRTASA